MLKVFRPAATAVIKSVIVGCRSAQTAARLSTSNIKFGCGLSLVEINGWTQAAALAAWNDVEHPILNNILASTYTATGWYEAIKLTSNTRGNDFRINFLVDDEVELLMNEVHTLTITGTSGTLGITLNTPLGPFDLSPTLSPEIETDLQDLINSIPELNPGDITVEATETDDGWEINLTFDGQFEGQTIDLTEIDTSEVEQPTAPATLTVVQAGSDGVDHKVELGFNVQPEYEYTNEVQLLTPSTSPAPSTGFFNLNIDGITTGWTAPIGYNSSISNIYTALDAVGIPDTDVTITGGPLPVAPLRFTFTGSLAGTDIPLMEVDNSGLLASGPDPSASVIEVRKGVAPGAGVNEVQTLTMTAGVTGGSFIITYPGEDPTAAIAYNASAAAIQSALEAVLGTGTVSASGGPINTTPVTLTFTGSWAATNVALPVITDTLTDGKSVETEIISSGSSTNGQRMSRYIGYSLGFNQHRDPAFTCSIIQYPGTSAIQTGATFSFTWLNPYKHDGSTLSITCTYGMTLREFWDAVRAAEIVEFDDSTRTGIFLGTSTDLDQTGLIPADPSRRFGEGEITRTGPSYPNAVSFIITEYALRYQDQLGGGSDWVPSFSFGPITNPGGEVVGEVAPSAGTPTQTVPKVRLAGTFSLSFTYGSTYSTGTIDTSSVNSIGALQDVIDLALADAGLAAGSIKILAFGLGHISRNESQFIIYEMAEDLAGEDPVDLAVTPISMTLNGLSSLVTPSSFDDKVLIHGGVVSADTVQQFFYLPNGTGATGNITWGITGSSATISTTASPSNSTLLSALQFLTGAPAGSITLSGGPLVTGIVTATFDLSLGVVNLITASYVPALTVVPATTTDGIAAGAGISEQQRITLSNTTGGTFTITFDTDTTDPIAWNAASSLVLARCTAAGLPIASVTGTSPWTLTFSTQADEDLLEVDVDDLTNYLPSQPYYTPSTVTDGGEGTVIGGLLGGTFDLLLTKTVDTVVTEYVVRGIPFDVSNSDLKDLLEAEIGEEIVITGGTLPGTPVQIEFTEGIGDTHWDVEVVPHLTIEGESGGTITFARRAVHHLPENVWDLEIIPGTDTPGLIDGPGATGLDAFYIYLKIVTPTGNLSEMLPPTTPISGGPEKTRFPSLVKIRWIDLTAEQLEQAINEAMGEIVCRVVQPIQSIEHADFDVQVPVASGQGTLTQRIKCWYMRSVFRIIFCGDFQDVDSITSIDVQLPTHEDGTPIDVQDFMTIDDPSIQPFSPGPDLIEDVLGDDKWDAARESSRISGAFYMAQLGGEPLHRFSIHRSRASGVLSWRFKLLDHYIIDTNEYIQTRFGSADNQPIQVRFHLAQRSINFTSMLHSYRLFASTPLLPYDAEPSQIKSAIEGIVPGLFGSGNIRVVGSLYESFETDSYNPANGIPGDAPINFGFNGLEISLINDLLYHPFNEYGLHIVMSIEYREADTPNELFFYRVAGGGGGPGRGDIENFPLRHFESLSDCPTPPFVNDRFTFTPEGSGPYSLSINGTTISLLSTDTAAQVETKFQTAFGVLPSGIGVGLPLYSWDTDTWTWTSTANPSHRTWMPERFAIPAKVFGTTVANGLSIELCSHGLQYRENDVAVGPAEYEEDPITLTVLVQGEGDQPTIWSLVIPSDATTGSININGTELTIPLDMEDLDALYDLVHASTTTRSGTTYTTVFTGTDSYEPDSFESDLRKPGSGTVSRTISGGLDGTLVISDLVSGAGPQWFTSSANWNDAVVPNSEDEIIFDDASGDVKYGIDLVGNFKACSIDRFIFTDRVNRFRNNQIVYVTHEDMETGFYYVRSPGMDGTFSLSATENGDPIEGTNTAIGTASLKADVYIKARYSGQFGLAEYFSGIPEYLPKYLRMIYTALVLGEGEGDGLSSGRFDTVSSPVDIIIHKSQDGDTYPAIQLLTNDVDTTILASNASVGIGIHLGETSEFDTFQGSSVNLTLGRNVIYTSINNNDGVTVSYKPVLHLT